MAILDLVYCINCVIITQFQNLLWLLQLGSHITKQFFQFHYIVRHCESAHLMDEKQVAYVRYIIGLDKHIKNNQQSTLGFQEMCKM